MFTELFLEGKKGATNGLERRIQSYFEKNGYTVGVLINYHNDNEIQIQLYKGDTEDIELEYRMPYDKQTPAKVFKETMKRLKNV